MANDFPDPAALDRSTLGLLHRELDTLDRRFIAVSTALDRIVSNIAEIIGDNSNQSYLKNYSESEDRSSSDRPFCNHAQPR